MPSIKQTPDGRPVVTTPEELAAYNELLDHEPLTTADKTRRFQVQCALESQNRGDAEALEAVEARKKLAIVKDATDITIAYDAPKTVQEYQRRLSALGRKVASWGCMLVTVPMAYREGRLERAVLSQNIGGYAVEVACLEIREATGRPIAGGDLESLEKFAAFRERARAIERAEDQAYAAERERKRAERAAETATDPAKRIRELERKLARALGEADPVDHEKWFEIPGAFGAVGQITVNGVPASPVDVS
jgi:hypothetical protein